MLTKAQADNIFKQASYYSNQGNMPGAISAVITEFERLKVGGGFIDMLILSEAKDTAGLKKQLEGYAFWPK